ncbi:MAG: DnaJ domain-containing protein [Planctomycetota bacterium]|nr:DnaJ domain-containing protein [Planctomycetota bacterium]
MEIRNFYEALQVSSNAELEVIEAAYKRLSLKYHPDRNAEADAEEKMALINQAYEALRDSLRRKDHDEALTRVRHHARESRRVAWEASKARQRDEDELRRRERAAQADDLVRQAWADRHESPPQPSQPPPKTFDQPAPGHPGKHPSNNQPAPKKADRVKAEPPPEPAPKKPIPQAIPDPHEKIRLEVASAKLVQEIIRLLDKGSTRNETIKQVVKGGRTLEHASVLVGTVIEERQKRGIKPPSLNRASKTKVPSVGYSQKKAWFLGLVAIFGILTILAFSYPFFREKPAPDSKEYESWLAQGEAALANAENNQAVEAFTRAIAASPDQMNAYRERALARTKSKDYAAAVLDFAKAIELGAITRESFEAKAFALGELGRHSEAINDYSRALELSPESAPLYLNRGINFFKAGKPGEAINDFNLALGKDPDEHRALYGRALANFELGNHAEAVADNTRYLAVKPLEAKAFYNRAVALKALGLDAKAAEDLNRAKELDPKIGE